MFKGVVLCLFMGIILGNEYNCIWDSGKGTFDIKGARYDVTSQAKYYMVFDNGTNSVERNYTYYFNICGDMFDESWFNNHPYCVNNTLRNIDNWQNGYCSNLTSDGQCYGYNSIDVDTAAYQLKDGNDDFCYRLHDGITPPQWSLINNDDSTEGFILTYINGDFCDLSGNNAERGQNRELNIKFECDIDNEYGFDIPDIEHISEPSDNLCSYYITVKSLYGCPTECSVTEEGLCNNKGLCDYDYTMNKAKCFCFDGYNGTFCEKTVPSTVMTPSPTIGNPYNNKTYPEYDGCQYTLNDTKGITAFYDLTYFNLNDDVFGVKDKENSDIYEYKFNICGEIPSTISPSIIPQVCWQYLDIKHGPCLEIFNNTCIKYHNVTDYATAVQIDYTDEVIRCYWLGTQLSDNNIAMYPNIKDDYSIELYDKDNSGRGVTFTLNNGDYCDVAHSNRQLKINFKCPDTRRYEPFNTTEELNIDETVLEDPTCVYTIDYESPLACPSNCVTQNGDEYAVCSNHGICSADPYAKEVRCFCDFGYKGTKCELQKSNFVEPTRSPSLLTMTPSLMPTESPISKAPTKVYPCEWDSGKGNFNLCKAYLNSESQFKYYTVYDDQIDSPGRNYTYKFNLCGDITERFDSPFCTNNAFRETQNLPVGYCSNFTSTGCGGYTEIDADTAAYQFKGTETDFCYRLHDGVTPPKWSLINEADSTEGFILTYYNGDYCQINGQNRELNIKFECDIENDDGYKIPDEERISEPSDNQCSYFITVESLYGCPTECKVLNGKLCGGNGVCDYDYTTNKAKCFCFDGYTGDYCSTKIAPTPTAVETPSPTTNENAYPGYDGCEYELTDTEGMTGFYDLKYFNLKDQVFDVNDKENTDIYAYKFNICGDIPATISPGQVPKQCWSTGKEHGPCLQIVNNTCVKYYNESDVATAVQVDTSDEYVRCYWLATQLNNNYLDDYTPLIKKDYSIELYDKDNAGLGVIFTLYNGDYCDSIKENRKLKIHLICPDTKRNTFLPDEELDINETVLEDPTCTYSLYYISPLACPSRCITPNKDGTQYSVCSNHGICSSDPYAKEIHCLCDFGYEGDKCESQKSGFIEPTKSPTPDTNSPTVNPTTSPTGATNSPTKEPTITPTDNPSFETTVTPSNSPTLSSNNPSITPTLKPINSDAQTDNTKSKKANTWMVLSVILIILLIIIFIVVFIIWKRRKNMISQVGMLDGIVNLTENTDTIA